MIPLAAFVSCLGCSAFGATCDTLTLFSSFLFSILSHASFTHSFIHQFIYFVDTVFLFSSIPIFCLSFCALFLFADFIITNSSGSLRSSKASSDNTNVYHSLHVMLYPLLLTNPGIFYAPSPCAPLSVSVFVCLFFLCFYLAGCLPIRPCASLSTCLSVCRSVCLFVCLCFCLCLSVCLSLYFLFIYFFAFPSYISGVHHFRVRFLRM